MISAFKDKYHKSQASTIIENVARDILDKGFPYRLKTPIIDWSITTVNNGWRVNPDMLSGKFSSRPHRLTVASYCIAVALKNILDTSNDHQLLLFHSMIYTTLISEVEVNGNLYGLTQIDYAVISMGNDLAIPIIEAISQISNKSAKSNIISDKPDKKMESIDYNIPAFIRNKAKQETH